jgi:hypothetical protein
MSPSILPANLPTWIEIAGTWCCFSVHPGGDFAVMRRENNYLNNATAHNIEEKQSKAALARIWSQMASSYCPNYVFPE